MKPNPVLFVHGIFVKKPIFAFMSPYFVSRGWDVHHVNLRENYGRWGIEKMAVQLRNYIAANFSPAQPFDIVGLSLGGLVSRYYIQRLRGIERVERFITISCPHNGTWMAYILPWWKTCIQMRPGSAFLQDLNRDVAILEQLHYTGLWTPLDFIIVPGSSSKLGVGNEVKLWLFSHAMMVMHPWCFKIVARALSSPIE